MQAPTVREVRLLYIAAAAAMIIMTTLGGIGFVHIAREPDALASTIREQSKQLDRQGDQIDALTRQLDQANHKLAVAGRRADASQRQVRATNRQVTAFVRYLRAHGLRVPRVFVGGGVSPKVPSAGPRRHRTSPAAPTPTAPSPSGPADLYCALIPALCTGLPLPSAVPSLLPWRRHR